MQSKRRWLPRWQRVELVELCLGAGLDASPGRGLATRVGLDGAVLDRSLPQRRARAIGVWGVGG